MDNVSVSKPTFDDILWEGYGVISRFKDVSAIKQYQTKLKSGVRSFKWALTGVYDVKKAQQIVDAVERQLVEKGLLVVKASLAGTEVHHNAHWDGDTFGVRIHINL